MDACHECQAKFDCKQDGGLRSQNIGAWRLGAWLVAHSSCLSDCFENRQKGVDKSREFVVICFDEFNAWQNSLDKKEREHAIKDYTRLIQLGRSFSIYVIISQQDAHKASLGLSRDSIGTVIALGKLSKETVSMLFSDEKDDIVRNNPRGVGYMKVDGQVSRHIIVPSYEMPPLENLIQKAVQRSDCYFLDEEAVAP